MDLPGIHITDKHTFPPCHVREGHPIPRHDRYFTNGARICRCRACIYVVSIELGINKVATTPITVGRDLKMWPEKVGELLASMYMFGTLKHSQLYFMDHLDLSNPPNRVPNIENDTQWRWVLCSPCSRGWHPQAWLCYGPNKEWTPNDICMHDGHTHTLTFSPHNCHYTHALTILVSIPYLVHNIFNRRTKLEDATLVNKVPSPLSIIFNIRNPVSTQLDFSYPDSFPSPPPPPLLY